MAWKGMMMEKDYFPEKWLNIEEAAKKLAQLTGKRVSIFSLMAHCMSGKCGAYLDCTDARGESLWDDHECITYGSGFCRLKHPKFTKSHPWIDSPRLFHWVTGPAVQHPIDKDGNPLPTTNQGENQRIHDRLEWFVDPTKIEYKPLFKPSGIQALAAKIAAEDRRLAEALELNTLREELELERAKRQEVESELAEMRRSFAEIKSEPVESRERFTYERLLYVLARQARYPLEGKCYNDEGLIQQYAARIGAKVPTGKGPIAKKLVAAVARFAEDQVDAVQAQDL